jgi:hypothetical protein
MLDLPVHWKLYGIGDADRAAAQLLPSPSVRVTLLYFDGCPHWQLGRERVRDALGQVGEGPDVLRTVALRTPEDAEAWPFRGSPTFLVNGRDPFATEDAPIGFACRLYGSEGSPSVDQLVEVLLAAG